LNLPKGVVHLKKKGGIRALRRHHGTENAPHGESARGVTSFPGEARTGIGETRYLVGGGGKKGVPFLTKQRVTTES